MYQYKVESLISVVDGDTIEVMLDLGFDHYYKNKVRLVGIDTPESRTTDLAEKKYGIEAKEFVKHTLEKSKIIVVKTEKPDSTEKFGRIIK
jgi:micrococcal nuclease